MGRTYSKRGPSETHWLRCLVQSDDVAVPWTENSARGRHQESLWAVLWHSRQLMGYLALRDIRLRYRLLTSDPFPAEA